MATEVDVFDIARQISRIEANRSVRDAIMAKLRSQRSPERISVTDLLNLKQAYFRRKHPEIVPSLERQQTMWAGTGFHDIFGAAVSSEEYTEQFVEWGEIVGRIDIYEDVPIEVKTTSNVGEEADLRRKRPAYIEQLGMYCAMVDAGEGKIVIYNREETGNSMPPLAVYGVRFSNLEAIRQKMARRRDLLLEALETGVPSGLPRCPWYERGCDYSSVCDCRTTIFTSDPTILELASDVYPDQKTTDELLAKLEQDKPGEALRLNDIVFPRKAYFAQRKGQMVLDEEAVDTEEVKERLTSIDRQGFLRVLGDAVRYGPSGEAQRVPANLQGLSDKILLHQGIPTIVRSSGLKSVVERNRLPELFTHYFLRLGFECALSGISLGRLILYYRNVPSEDGKLLVYDISFRSLEGLKAEVMSRIDLLGKAGNLEELPACPSWMCRFCKYVTDCVEVG
jgi:hypothetical protein